MSGAGLEVKDLWVSLGGRQILHGINLDLEAGAVHGILGPNGCGKTTLIRSMCGAVKPDSGQVLLDGTAIGALSPTALARRMAVVWQGGVISSDITVARLVSYGRYAHTPWWKVNPPDRDEAVVEAMERTHITSLADRRVASLSGGERQRVWIATALAQRPRILLLDEPTTYLDIAHQIDVLELIGELNADGLTVVAVLHDLTQAARRCDRVVVMDNGRLLRAGPPVQALDAAAIASDFQVDAWVTTDPQTHAPVIQARHRTALHEENQ